MFTTREIELIRTSWAAAQSDVDRFIRLFYEHLFEADPVLRVLFKSDPAPQCRALAGALQSLVDGLTKPVAQVAPLRRLGARHVHYGAKDKHYLSVGTALRGALAKILGDRFTADVEDAWIVFYATVTSIMRSGARATGTEALAARQAARVAKVAPGAFPACAERTIAPARRFARP